MHLLDRWRLIVANLSPDQVTSVEQLCERLNVSSATIRRDLAELDKRGELKRIRGGAVPVKSDATSARRNDRGDAAPRLKGQIAFDATQIENLAEKKAIAAKAIQLCKANQSIIIDGGTTTFVMASSLPDLPFHVLTTSLPILNILMEKPGIQITLPGGQVFREQSIVLNPYNDDILENFSAAAIFIGAQAVSKRGLQQTDPLLVQTERRLLERADRVVVLADSSKFSADASLAVCPLSDIDVIITDSSVSQSHQDMVQNAGVELLVVKSGNKPGDAAA